MHVSNYKSITKQNTSYQRNEWINSHFQYVMLKVSRHIHGKLWKTAPTCGRRVYLLSTSAVKTAEAFVVFGVLNLWYDYVNIATIANWDETFVVFRVRILWYDYVNTATIANWAETFVVFGLLNLWYDCVNTATIASSITLGRRTKGKETHTNKTIKTNISAVLPLVKHVSHAHKTKDCTESGTSLPAGGCYCGSTLRSIGNVAFTFGLLRYRKPNVWQGNTCIKARG